MSHLLPRVDGRVLSGCRRRRIAFAAHIDRDEARLRAAAVRRGDAGSDCLQQQQRVELGLGGLGRASDRQRQQQSERAAAGRARRRRRRCGEFSS